MLARLCPNQPVQYLAEAHHLFSRHLRTTCDLILKHADNDDISCFGNDVACRTATLFDLKATKRVPNPPKLVQDTLLSLLHDAARIVRSHLAELTSSRNENPEVPYPYFAVRSWEVGVCDWYTDDGHFGPCGQRWRLSILARAKVDLVPAPRAWTSVVGLREDGGL